METDPSARVQLRSRSELMHPGSCTLCGSGNCEDGYVDLGVYFDYEGQLYICWNCVQEVIKAVGGLSVEEHDFIRGQMKGMAEELIELKRQLEIANGRVADYYALLDRVSEHVSSPDRATGSDAVPIEQGSNELNAPVINGRTDGKPVLKKSTAGSRRANASLVAAGNASKSTSGPTDPGL